MNNKKIYSGALCLEDKKKTVKPSELKDLDSHLDKEISCFHYWRKWWLFHRFLLSVASSWVGFIRLCLLHPRRPRPGSSWFREKRFRLFLLPCVCEDGLPVLREREKRKLLSCSRGALLLLLHYSLLKRFFLCLAEKSYILFCRKTVAGLNKELQNKTLLHLAETDRLRHTEHQLHASESKVERLNSENIKLRLKIDDLRIKLQNRKLSIF